MEAHHRLRSVTLDRMALQLHRVNWFWLLICVACLGTLIACHATPAGAAAWAATGTAAVDAGSSQLVQAGVWSPETASAFSGWAHLIQDTLANATGLAQKLHEVQAQHSEQMASLRATIPTTTDRVLDIAAASVGGAGITRVHRGEVTPKKLKLAA